jgi:virulence factor Mce-like protein
MVVFALATIGVLMFLWLSFGGPLPLKPKSYQLKIDFPEATTLAQEADVRIAGVTVGKVRQKALDKHGNATTATLSIDPKYAPIPKDSRAILRQKTLLGETYVELTPGNRRGPKLADGAHLRRTQIEPTVELDEILKIFDPETKKAFRQWVAYSAQAIKAPGGQDLNFALGNLAEFANSGAGVLSVLNTQQDAVTRVVRDTGTVFAALNQRYGQLHDLVLNSQHTFGAIASEKTALAQTFSIFPVFLDESRATLARLSAFALNTRPLVNLLKPVADQLGPTVTDLGNVGPPLEQLFRNLKPVIAASGKDLPQGARFLKGAIPLFHGLHTFLPELNPILSLASFYQAPVAHFFVNGGGATHSQPIGPGADGAPRYMLPFDGSLGNAQSLALASTRPQYDRGNAYLAPNNYRRAPAFWISESFDCRNDHPDGNGTTDHAGRRNPVDTTALPGGVELAPCFVQPPSLFDRKRFNRLQRSEAPLVPAPFGLEGTIPATP